MRFLFLTLLLFGILNSQVIEVNKNWKLVGAKEDILDMKSFDNSCILGLYGYKDGNWLSYMQKSGGDLTHISNGDGFWIKGLEDCEIETDNSKILNPQITLDGIVKTNLNGAKLYKKDDSGFKILAIADEDGAFKDKTSFLSSINDGEIYKIVSDEFNYLDYFFIKNDTFYTYEECDLVNKTRKLKSLKARELVKTIKLSKTSKPIQSTRGDFSHLLSNITSTREVTQERDVPQIIQELIEKQEGFLQINTRGHIGIITQILVKENILISASEDKTIKIWDLHHNNLIGEIRGEVGDGFGAIADIELSNNKNLLIASVVDNRKIEAKPTIRIYDFKTKEILQVLRDDSVIKRTDISEDDNYLVAGFTDGSIKVYQKSKEYVWSDNDVEVKTTFELLKTIQAHDTTVNDVKIFKDKDSYKIVSASYDNTIKLFNLNGDLLNSFEHKDARSIAISKDYIATGGYDRIVNIYDRDLNPIKSIDVAFRQKNLAFSPNGEFLITSAWDNDRKIESRIYKMSDFTQLSSFDKQIENLGGVGFVDNKTAISAGGYDAQEIYTWDIQTGETIGKFMGFGSPVTSVAIDGKNILFGNEILSDEKIKSHYQANTKSFSLEDFIISEDVNSSKAMPLTYNEYSLSHTAGGKYGDLDAILMIDKANAPYKEILRESSSDGFIHKVYGFTDSGLIISGGHVGILKAYNLEGEEVANFEGHTDTLLAIANYGDILVSGSKDNIIKIWNLKEIGDNKTLYPLLNIFVGSCGEWLMWNRDGHFTSSYNGSKFVGYHINQGADKEAQFIEFGKIYEYFFRPDLITKDIEALF